MCIRDSLRTGIDMELDFHFGKDGNRILWIDWPAHEALFRCEFSLLSIPAFRMIRDFYADSVLTEFYLNQMKDTIEKSLENDSWPSQTKKLIEKMHDMCSEALEQGVHVYVYSD